MPIVELPPSRSELPELKPPPRIDWIVASLFSTYGERIHPVDKSLEGLLRLTRGQLWGLASVLCGFVTDQAVKDGINRWALGFSEFLLPQRSAA